MDEHEPYRSLHLINGPENGGDKHGNLRNAHNHLLQVTEAKAQEAQEQTDPDAIDDDQEETGGQKD